MQRYVFSKPRSPNEICDAYAEAGIEIVFARGTKPVPHPKQIPERGSIWTDSALTKP
jgi:hypothetical protein